MFRMLRRFLIFPLFFTILIQFSQASYSKEGFLIAELQHENPLLLYDQAVKDLSEDNYDKAIINLEKLAFYPHELYVYESAKILLTYAYYTVEDYDSCIKAIDNLLKYNPYHKKHDGLLYLKAMAYYSLAFQKLSVLFNDPYHLNENHFIALREFQELLKLYPDSQYAEQSRSLVKQLQNMIADSRLQVAYVYQQNSKNLAAINILFSIVRDYPKSDVVPEVLYRISAIYLHWGLIDSGRGVIRYLVANYPDNFWTQEAQKLYHNL